MKQANRANLPDYDSYDTSDVDNHLKINKNLCNLIIKSLKKAPDNSSKNFFFRNLTLNKKNHVKTIKANSSEFFDIETKEKSNNSSLFKGENDQSKLESICFQQQKQIEHLQNDNLNLLNQNQKLREEYKRLKSKKNTPKNQKNSQIIKRLEEKVEGLLQEKKLQSIKINFLNKKIEEETVNAFEKDNIISVLNKRIREVERKYDIEIQKNANNPVSKNVPFFKIKSINEINRENLEWSFTDKKNVSAEESSASIKEKLKTTEDFLHRVMLNLRDYLKDSSNRDKMKTLFQHYITNYVEKQLIIGDRNTA